MSEIGKMLVGVGLLIALAGALLLVAARTGLPLGRLPGDFIYRGRNFRFYFPLATCVVISVVLSAVLYVISRLRR